MSHTVSWKRVSVGEFRTNIWVTSMLLKKHEWSLFLKLSTEFESKTLLIEGNPGYSAMNPNTSNKLRLFTWQNLIIGVIRRHFTRKTDPDVKCMQSKYILNAQRLKNRFVKNTGMKVFFKDTTLTEANWFWSPFIFECLFDRFLWEISGFSFISSYPQALYWL